MGAAFDNVDPAVGQIFNAAPAGQRMELHVVRHSVRVPVEAVAEEAPPAAAAGKGGTALEDSDNGLEPRSLNDSFTQTGEEELPPPRTRKEDWAAPWSKSSTTRPGVRPGRPSPLARARRTPETSCSLLSWKPGLPRTLSPSMSSTECLEERACSPKTSHHL